MLLGGGVGSSSSLSRLICGQTSIQSLDGIENSSPSPPQQPHHLLLPSFYTLFFSLLRFFPSYLYKQARGLSLPLPLSFPLFFRHLVFQHTFTFLFVLLSGRFLVLRVLAFWDLPRFFRFFFFLRSLASRVYVHHGLLRISCLLSSRGRRRTRREWSTDWRFWW